MKVNPVRVAELVTGVSAAVLPVAASRFAIALAVVAVVALTAVAWKPVAEVRTVAACAIVGNAIVLGEQPVLLWADAVLLLLFLALGGWAEAGVWPSSQGFRADLPKQAFRVGLGTLAIAVLTLVAQLHIAASLWLVVLAMIAGLAVLVLARRGST